MSHFSLKQAQSLKIKFNESIKLKDFTFVAIVTNTHDEKEMEQKCFSQQDITSTEKEIEIYKGDFYMVYPVRRQMVVAFGEG